MVTERKPAGGGSAKKQPEAASAAAKLGAVDFRDADVAAKYADSLVAQDYISARRRILANAPLNLDLAEQAKLGKLKCNPATVAREAKRARGPIASGKGAYPEIYALIVGDKNPRQKGQTQKERNHELVVKNLNLTAAMRTSQSRMVAMIRRMDKMEKEFKKRVGQKAREQKKTAVDLKIVGKELANKCEACGRPL